MNNKQLHTHIHICSECETEKKRTKENTHIIFISSELQSFIFIAIYNLLLLLVLLLPNKKGTLLEFYDMSFVFLPSFLLNAQAHTYMKRERARERERDPDLVTYNNPANTE